MNVKFIQIGISILKFLLEVIDGPCYENQNIIIEARFFECVKFIVSIHTDKMERIKRGFDKEKELLHVLTGYLLMVVRGIIEGNDQSLEFCNQLRSVLTMPFLLKKIYNDLKIYFHSENQAEILQKLSKIAEKSHFDEKFENIYVTFFVTKLLYFYEDDIADFSKLSTLEKTLFNFFEQHSASIEVIYKDKIYKIYHIIQPIFRNLREEFKDEIMDSIKRDAPKKKVQDFLNKTNMIFDVITYEDSLKSNVLFSRVLYKFVNRLCLFLNLLTNLIMFFFFKKEVDKNGYGMTSPEFDESNWYLRVLGGVHLAVSGFKLFLWLIYLGRIEAMKEWRNLFEKVGKKLKMEPKYIGSIASEEDLELVDKNYTDLNYNQRMKLLFLHSKINNMDTTFPLLDYIIYQTSFITKSPMFKFMLFYFLMNYVAFSRQIFFFYSILLLDVINFDSTLLNVTKSIVLNYKQLSLTGILGLIIIYLFSFLGFDILSEDFFMFDIGDGPTPENKCSSLIQCFSTLVSLVRFEKK